MNYEEKGFPVFPKQNILVLAAIEVIIKPHTVALFQQDNVITDADEFKFIIDNITYDDNNYSLINDYVLNEQQPPKGRSQKSHNLVLSMNSKKRY